MHYDPNEPNFGKNIYTPPPVNPNTPPQMQNTGSTSKVLGILALVLSLVCCSPIITLVLGILAVNSAAKATRENGFTPPAASTGRICGIIAIVFAGLSFILSFIAILAVILTSAI